MLYFEQCTTIDEVKKLYKQLALTHHPDRGVDTATMQAINTEYAFACARLAKLSGKSTEQVNEELNLSEEYRRVIESIIHLPDIIIEIVGLWIWVTANTKPVKDQLHKAGFHFAHKKVAWYYRNPLYTDRLNKLINQPGMYDCAQSLDEFGSIRATAVLNTIQTGRSNNIITILAVQDYSMLKTIYSKEEADVIFNITGNIISGQGSGESARFLSERFPKTFQDRESISINSGDTSISRSKQLDQSLPASTIAGLSSGEFVGIVADNPDQPIKNKPFHSRIVNDHTAIKKEKENYLPLPVVHKNGPPPVYQQFIAIKKQALDIVDAVLEQVLNNPQFNIIQKP